MGESREQITLGLIVQGKWMCITKKNENRGEHLTLGKQRIEEWGEDLNSNRNGENREWEREREKDVGFYMITFTFFLKFSTSIFFILLWFCAFPTFESNDLMSQMTIQGKNVREIFKTNERDRDRKREKGMKKSERERRIKKEVERTSLTI